ncbi:hypothetical protein [Rhizobium leucaenae]|uniref:hypothetical protein n=1 Tax=Rhizobium leucaenae TaxID=29450 RepID=UPI0007EE80EE|nr:hypothetical protein [Rhizobium leucaenae]
MTYTIKAIPTTYNHVRFRSRLEARWAAFFDLAGWQWDYEPFDLDGWAPDFMLKGKIRALVEVKPINFADTEGGAMTQAKAQAAKAFATAARVSPSFKDITEEEIISSRRLPPQYEIMVIGNGPFVNDSWNKWGIGVMAIEEGCRGEDYADLFWGDTQYLDYAARYGNYRYRVGGQYDGDHHLNQIRDDTPERLWREAGNIVQWNPDNTNYRRRKAA